jgi:hypothetical protein
VHPELTQRVLGLRPGSIGLRTVHAFRRWPAGRGWPRYVRGAAGRCYGTAVTFAGESGDRVRREDGSAPLIVAKYCNL